MISWKTQLAPAEMMSLAAYVGTLQGTNPANPNFAGGGAFADGMPEEPIFGLFFWANGLPWNAKHGSEQAMAGYPDLWTPAQTGPGYAPTPLLMPLAAHQVTVATGLEPKTEIPPNPPGQSDGHMRGFMVAMTGDRLRPEGFDQPAHLLTALRPTLDQVIARHPMFYQSPPRFRSIQVGVSRARFHEFGHYLVAQIHGLKVTLPYFIPMPLPPLGTMGAFIRLKAPIDNRRALFDMAIAGPLAGFALALPLFILGLLLPQDWVAPLLARRMALPLQLSNSLLTLGLTWLLKPDVIPPVPPPHLRVVCSARTGIMGSVESYLQLLNWGKEICHLDELGSLSPAGFLDVLANLGAPLPALVRNTEFVDRLYALTGGDPLLVTLYAEALRPYGDEPPVIATAEDLVGLQSGYDGFFKSLFMRQYEDQEAFWRAGGDRAAALPVGPLLCVLAVALGPLASDDLRVLLADVFPDQATLIATIKSLRRFLLSQTSRPYGDAGDGYVFSHVRMADYFGSEAWMSESDRQATIRRLTGYCRDHCAAIRGGELAPSAISAYVVQYWGAHLVKHVAAPRAELAELICEPWLHAWEHVTGTASSFLADADRAAEFARKEGAAGIGLQVRVALCHSSLASLGANLQKDVLLALAKANRISPPRAIDLALNRQNLRERVEYLVALRSVLPTDWLAIHIDAQDLVFKSDLLGVDRLKNNLQVHLGATVFF